MYFENKFPKVSDAKMEKKGVFIGPQVRELIQNVKFRDQLSDVMKSRLENYLKFPLPIFWGNGKAENCRDMATALVCNISLPKVTWKSPLSAKFSAIFCP